MGKWSREKGVCPWQTADTQKTGTRKIRMAAANMARGPMASPSLGDLPPYLAERAEGGEPKLVSPSQTHQGMSLVDDKPL